MKFQPERLISLRTTLGLNKAEAAKMLNLSAMGYGRYEKGEREPSFQTVSFIASTFGTTTDYLYGITDSFEADSITVFSAKDPELFSLIKAYRQDERLAQRLLSYLNNSK